MVMQLYSRDVNYQAKPIITYHLQYNYGYSLFHEIEQS